MKFSVRIKHTPRPAEAREMFADIREWLETHIGERGKDWDFVVGDLHAYAVLLPTKEDALAFRITFSHATLHF